MFLKHSVIHLFFLNHHTSNSIPPQNPHLLPSPNLNLKPKNFEKDSPHARILHQLRPNPLQRNPPHTLIIRRLMPPRIQPAIPLAAKQRFRSRVEFLRGREGAVFRPHGKRRDGEERQHARGL